ncbi:MAG: hypothetical protein JXR83_22220 [Deltaproteobacteria bacterium]|nr:hypothetical protein [Deltaproteobacteria bacterium]
MLSVTPPRTNPFIAFVGLSVWYGLAALIATIWPVGRTIGPEYVLALTVLTALATPVGAVVAGAHHIAHDPRVLLESLLATLLPLLVAPLLTVVIFILLPSCDATSSLVLYALGPPPTALLVVALVALLGRIVPRRWIVAALVYAFAIVSIAWTAWYLYREPPTWFLNHFFGSYVGVLYDEAAGIDSRILRFRLLTWLWALGGLLLAYAMAPRRGRTSRSPAAGALLLLVAAVVLGWRWHEQLRPDRDDIERSLGQRVSTPHFEIYVDRAMRRDEIERLARDHEFRYEQLRQQLGVLPQEKVRSFVYPSAARKAELIGAAGVQLARPWQLEMHLNASRFPHPVLAHELVHVLTSTMGSGPLRVSSRFGLLMRPGLVEGLAVALEPDTDELSQLDQARALKQLGYLPEISTYLSLTGFWYEAPARAYTGAGSLLRFLLQTHGLGRVREFYRSGDFSMLAGATEDSVRQAWHAWLDAAPPSAQALAMLRRRFEHAAPLEQRCVHARGSRFEQIDRLLAAGRRVEAIALLRELHQQEPTDGELAHRLGGIAAEFDDSALLAEAVQWQRALGGLTPIEEADLALGEGAVAWRGGDEERACQHFELPSLEALPAGHRRQLTVLRLACEWRGARDPAVQNARVAILDYLVGKGPVAAGGRADLLALQQARGGLTGSAHPIAGAFDGLLAYLIARQLIEPDPTRAAALFDASLQQPGLDPELRLAALKARAAARYLGADLDGAQSDFEQVAAFDRDGWYGRRAHDFIERIAFERIATIEPVIEELAAE